MDFLSYWMIFESFWLQKYGNEAISELRRSWETIRSISPSPNHPRSRLEPFPASSEQVRCLYQKKYFLFWDLRISQVSAGEMLWPRKVMRLSRDQDLILCNFHQGSRFLPKIPTNEFVTQVKTNARIRRQNQFVFPSKKYYLTLFNS